jgi:hypothetical protein
LGVRCETRLSLQYWLLMPSDAGTARDAESDSRSQAARASVKGPTQRQLHHPRTSTSSERLRLNWIPSDPSATARTSINFGMVERTAHFSLISLVWLDRADSARRSCSADVVRPVATSRAPSSGKRSREPLPRLDRDQPESCDRFWYSLQVRARAVCSRSPGSRALPPIDEYRGLPHRSLSWLRRAPLRLDGSAVPRKYDVGAFQFFGNATPG